MPCNCCRPSAPFLQYAKIDAEVCQDGVQCAKEWQAHWNHRPGGPYYPSNADLKPNCPAWVEYVETLKRHNLLWRMGWEVEMKRLRPKFLASLGSLPHDIKTAMAANFMLMVA